MKLRTGCGRSVFLTGKSLFIGAMLSGCLGTQGTTGSSQGNQFQEEAGDEETKTPPRRSFPSEYFYSGATPPSVSQGPTNDPLMGWLWAVHNEGQTYGTPDVDIDAREAWSLETDCRSVLIGVIDTGVDWTHPDLAANIWNNTSEIPDNGRDDDGNGYVDDVRGWDFRNNDNNPYDDHYHGTHVAGTIGAIGNNSTGVAGVCWTAQIVPLKFLGSNGSGSISDAIEAIDYATSLGVKITNNSWGGTGHSELLSQAIQRAANSGHLFVAAAGNSGVNNSTYPHYPASYGKSNVLSVASITHSGEKSSFSNFGNATVDLAAPGSNIMSTYPGSAYTRLSGTSMATPQVAGAAALLWSHDPTLNMTQVRSRIVDRVVRADSLNGQLKTNGWLNAHHLIDQNYSASSASFQISSLSASYDSHSIQLNASLLNTSEITSDAIEVELLSADGTFSMESSSPVSLSALDYADESDLFSFEIEYDFNEENYLMGEMNLVVRQANGFEQVIPFVLEVSTSDDDSDELEMNIYE